MKITGFTIIRNAVKNDYPIVEAISSILPVVDEMIVLVGDSEDATEDLIRSIPSDKIRIEHSTWDPTIKKGGEILAVETNKAFDLIGPEADWAFYIQADEVIHEKYHAAIRAAAEQYKNDDRVQGLLFNYVHFYGTYDYVADSRRWYHKEVRIIRNDKKIRSYRDAQGFRINEKRIRVRQIPASVYHYGWVKSPGQMLQKQKNTVGFWSDQEETNRRIQAQQSFDFSGYESIHLFEDSHPTVMHKRIEEQNWKVELDVTKKKLNLKNRFLRWVELKTGKRWFDFRNYELLK